MHAIVLFLAAQMALGAFEYRNSPPLGLFPFPSAVQDHDDAGSITNPAYLPLVKCPFVNFSMDAPYGVSGLTSNGVTLGAPLGSFGVQGAWRRFGIREYREDIVTAYMGWAPLRMISLGAGMSYSHISIDSGEISFSAGLADFSASLKADPFSWMSLSFEQDNIRSLADAGRRDLLFPERRFGISLLPVRGLTLSWNLSSTFQDRVSMFSLGARLLPVLFIKGGYSREASTYAAAFSLALKNITASYGIRYHSYLGLTHSLGITSTWDGTVYESLEYYSRRGPEPPDDPGERIDINRCSADELAGIPAVSETMAARIMKYREILGPLSKKALGQLGMSDREISLLMRYAYGLAEDEKRPHDRERKKTERAGAGRVTRGWGEKGVNVQARRRIFERLLESGLGASLSLMLSEAAAKNDTAAVRDAVNAVPGLSPEKKREIMGICRQ